MNKKRIVLIFILLLVTVTCALLMMIHMHYKPEIIHVVAEESFSISETSLTIHRPTMTTEPSEDARTSVLNNNEEDGLICVRYKTDSSGKFVRNVHLRLKFAEQYYLPHFVGTTFSHSGPYTLKDANEICFYVESLVSFNTEDEIVLELSYTQGEFSPIQTYEVNLGRIGELIKED